MQKQCTKCKEFKNLEAFGNLKRGKDGKCPYCKECAKKMLVEWSLPKQEHIRERSRQYVHKYWRKQRESKSQEYINELLKNGIRRYVVDRKGKSHEQILGASFQAVRQFLESKFQSGMSWENHGQWHIDHIIPLSSAKSQEEFIKLNHYTNLQPLWAKDNLSKGAKFPSELER